MANVGLRYAVDISDCSSDVKSFVHNNFYVDDACRCSNFPQKAVEILSETRKVLQSFNIRLHKICSNSPIVTNSFPASERMETSSITLADPTTQHTLGIEWNTKSDNFVVRTNVPDRPFTKRGVLATCNSTFDPLGFVSPIILTGRILQRMLIPAKSSDPTLANLDWDDPLPSEYLSQWNDWKASLR